MSPSKRRVFSLTFSTEPEGRVEKGIAEEKGRKESTHRGLITLHNYFGHLRVGAAERNRETKVAGMEDGAVVGPLLLPYCGVGSPYSSIEAATRIIIHLLFP